MKREFLHPALINYENQMTEFLEQQRLCRYCFTRGCQGECLVKTFAPELETKVEQPPTEAPHKRFSLYGLLALLAVWWFVAWFVVQILEGYQ